MMKQDRRKPSWSVADRVRYNIQHHLEDAAPRVHRYVNSTSFFVRRMSDSLQKIPENGRPKSTEQQVVLQSKLILRDYLQWEVKRQKAASPHPLVTVSHIAPSSPYRDDSAGDPLATTATTTSSPHKLEEKDDVIGNLLKLTISDCSDVSQQVIAMGRELELRYPNIFKGVANNLRLNLSSPNQLITAYQTVSQELFRFGKYRAYTYRPLLSFVTVCLNREIDWSCRFYYLPVHYSEVCGGGMVGDRAFSYLFCFVTSSCSLKAKPILMYLQCIFIL